MSRTTVCRLDRFHEIEHRAQNALRRCGTERCSFLGAGRDSYLSRQSTSALTDELIRASMPRS